MTFIALELTNWMGKGLTKSGKFLVYTFMAKAIRPAIFEGRLELKPN